MALKPKFIVIFRNFSQIAKNSTYLPVFFGAVSGGISRNFRGKWAFFAENFAARNAIWLISAEINRKSR